ncbi:MAG: hypothetical protein M0Z66_05435 [Thermaerobacter sp.]|nr:hypothetical protein [Thermaerobacter sp.]
MGHLNPFLRRNEEVAAHLQQIIAEKWPVNHFSMMPSLHVAPKCHGMERLPPRGPLESIQAIHLALRITEHREFQVVRLSKCSEIRNREKGDEDDFTLSVAERLLEVAELRHMLKARHSVAMAQEDQQAPFARLLRKGVRLARVIWKGETRRQMGASRPPKSFM